jgi:hypothetical protein
MPNRRRPSPSVLRPSIFPGPMIHTVTVGLAPGDVLARAKAFFAERVPHASAFPEKEGPQFVLLRGQGGEEVVISARSPDGDQGAGRCLVKAPLRPALIGFPNRHSSSVELRDGHGARHGHGRGDTVPVRAAATTVAELKREALTRRSGAPE